MSYSDLVLSQKKPYVSASIFTLSQLKNDFSILGYSDHYRPKYYSNYNIFKLLHAVQNTEWQKKHPLLATRVVCEAHELTDYGNLNPEIIAKIEDLKNKFPTVETIVVENPKLFKIENVSLFKKLITGISQHQVNLPLDSIEQLIENFHVLMDYASQFSLEKSTQDLIVQTLNTYLAGTENLSFKELLPHLLPLMERGLIITELNLSGIVDIHVDALKDFKELRKLTLSNCPNLVNLEGLSDCTHLEELDLSNCPMLIGLNGLRNCIHLKRLDLSNCSKLNDIVVIKNFEGLQTLNLKDCHNLINFRPVWILLKNSKELRLLDLSGCKKLSLDNFKEISLKATNKFNLRLRISPDRKDLEDWLRSETYGTEVGLEVKDL
jgi:hypothetical protein